MDGLHARNCVMRAQVDMGKPRLYEDLVGKSIYTLVFQHHAELVNIVWDNHIQTHIVVAVKNSRPEISRHAKTRTDIRNGTTNVQWDHVQLPFRNVPTGNWDPHCYKKPIVPVSVQHRVARVGVIFVTVEVVNTVKMVNLHVGPD